MTFARLVALPENRSGLLALTRLAARLTSVDRCDGDNPLYLRGPSGSGKTTLVNALLSELARHRPGPLTAVIQAAELRDRVPSAESLAANDLIVLEDLQRVPARHAPALASLLDELTVRGVQVIVTAAVGPGYLELPARLRSRLASGLVVGLEPLSPASRLALLEDKAERRQVAVSRDILAWLAGRLRSPRELEGALSQLQMLSRSERRPLTLATVNAHFTTEEPAERPAVERIARGVGRYFRVEPAELKSARRHRHVALPRQVGMYLVRQLTGLSLAEIGAYFGGRDHTTVLHACRKVEQALGRDPALSGAVRDLRASLP